jgi:SPP1 family predicted phage head-tail adaptor
MINAGKYNRRIIIYKVVKSKDSAGFPIDIETVILTTYANVKTLRGYTLITNDTNFEKAYINFTIRYPQNIEITRDMLISFRGKTYSIEYLNNIDFANVELEIQAKEVTH